MFDIWKKSNHFIGFDDLFTRLEKSMTEATKLAMYPPYNLRKIGENKYVVELAVAGFTKSDIEVSLEDDVLRISGKTENQDPEGEVLHKGIAERAFLRTFSVADSVVVKNAQLVNGILKVFLENVIPESKKPKRIEIETPKQLLTE